ncbi:hypothetical protein [Fructobacillus tropaeoli]|uniref:hypothetical protein n=1 Tax=Fructobacillus tropaeoli TaxID=709323 RepID=UPI0030C7BB08
MRESNNWFKGHFCYNKSNDYSLPVVGGSNVNDDKVKAAQMAVELIPIPGDCWPGIGINGLNLY